MFSLRTSNLRSKNGRSYKSKGLMWSYFDLTSLSSALFHVLPMQIIKFVRIRRFLRKWWQTILRRLLQQKRRRKMPPMWGGESFCYSYTLFFL